MLGFVFFFQALGLISLTDPPSVLVGRLLTCHHQGVFFTGTLYCVKKVVLGGWRDSEV